MEIIKDILDWWYTHNHGPVIGIYTGVIIGVASLIFMSWYDEFPENNILCGVLSPL